MAYFKCNGSGKKSLVLPTNPTISIKEDDAKLTLEWDTPTSETEIDHYNIYASLVEPSSLADMEFKGSVDVDSSNEEINVTATQTLPFTLNGITFTKSNNKIIVNGTATDIADLDFIQPTLVGGENYSLSGTPKISGYNTKENDNDFDYKFQLAYNEQKYIDYGNGSEKFIYNSSYTFNSLVIRINKGRTVSNIEFEPKVIHNIPFSYTLDNLTNDQTYYVAVESVDKEGYENASIWKVENGTPREIIWFTVGALGYSAYSTDGITWNSGFKLFAERGYYSVAYGNERFVAVGANTRWCSTKDGKSMYNGGYYMDNGSNWFGIDYANCKFVVVGGGGVSFYQLDNSIIWVAISGLSTSYNYYNVVYGKGKFLTQRSIGGYCYIYTLTDNATTWSEYGRINATSSGAFTKLSYTNGMFISVGNYGKAYYSQDGTTWVANSIGDTEAILQGIDYGNSRYIVVGYNNSGLGVAYSSTDLTTWTRIGNLGVSFNVNNFDCLHYAKDRFVCVGSKGQSYYLLDNSDTWIAMSGLDTSIQYNSVCSNK